MEIITQKSGITCVDHVLRSVLLELPAHNLIERKHRQTHSLCLLASPDVLRNDRVDQTFLLDDVSANYLINDLIRVLLVLQVTGEVFHTNTACACDLQR